MKNRTVTTVLVPIAALLIVAIVLSAVGIATLPQAEAATKAA